MRAHQPQSPAN